MFMSKEEKRWLRDLIKEHEALCEYIRRPYSGGTNVKLTMYLDVFGRPRCEIPPLREHLGIDELA